MDADKVTISEQSSHAYLQEYVKYIISKTTLVHIYLFIISSFNNF